MEASAIPTPTPYLDGLILAATAYPSGLSASLFALRARPQQQGLETAFLALLVLPFVAATAAVGWLRPGLLELRAAPVPLFALAAVAAPVALVAEFVVHGLVAYRKTGRVPRGITLESFWNQGLSPAQHLLLAMVVVGEEIVYRQLWLGALVGSFGLPAPIALGLSSLLYGLNHLAFGFPSVASKTLAGLLYGGLFVAAGGSLWPGVVAHGLHNLLIFLLAARDHG